MRKKLFDLVRDEKTIQEKLAGLSLALEHFTYKTIPGTKCSYRVDPQNTNTMTQKHAHVYAKPSGGGKELYSINLDGSGHDSSSGKTIPASHAKYFQNLGFSIPSNLALESLDYSSLSLDDYEFVILEG
ncbi:hypothetical protein CRENPOLYSF2_400002 [Crenothrix polyspora]|uniref:Uncharacterized protein n=1 Tax=Crenothrix polyspora TaxID=360316 RepID=A0A1R4HEX2_9GAMM|nr:hypothetical protein [Crenothrix polyspora]SJM94450.1 hypothetical protein CRENPOLYSF2_400002 [Crenothrix polyspora]